MWTTDLLVPLGVGLAPGDATLDLLVLDDPALLEVDEEQLAGREPPLALDVLGGDGHHAGLGGEHDVALGVLDPAARAAARCGRAPRRRGGRR